jgi:hypothetical protein
MLGNSPSREDDAPFDTKRRGRHRILSVSLLAAACSMVSAQAPAQVLISRQMAGNAPGCWGTGYLGNFRIDPVLDNNGNTAYRIIWASFGSGTNYPLVQVAQGIAPAKAVQFSAWAPRASR